MRFSLRRIAAVAIVLAAASGQAALADSCSSEATLKAQPGGTATDIFFHNGSSEQRRVYWLDETGQRKLKAVVEAGKTERASTVAGHPWVVTDGSEKCLHIVVAPAVPVTAEIGEGPGSARPASAEAPSMSDASPAATSTAARLGLSGWYQISAASKPGRALNNMASGRPEIERVKGEWDSAYWEIADVPSSGYVTITSKWTQKNLAADAMGLHTVAGAERGQGAHWLLESVENGRYVLIKSRLTGRYLTATANGFEYIDKPGPGNAALWQLGRATQSGGAVGAGAAAGAAAAVARRAAEEKHVAAEKSRKCPSGERFDPDRGDCVSIKCGRHQVYSKSEGQCLDKSNTCPSGERFDPDRGDCVSIKCGRHQVYSKTERQCLDKSSTCSSNEVYSSSLAACIPKEKPKATPDPKPKPKPKPKVPACVFKMDGVGNCLTPQFLACQKAYGACMKACGSKAGKCEAACHTKYSSKCGD